MKWNEFLHIFKELNVQIIYYSFMLYLYTLNIIKVPEFAEIISLNNAIVIVYELI